MGWLSLGRSDVYIFFLDCQGLVYDMITQDSGRGYRIFVSPGTYLGDVGYRPTLWPIGVELIKIYKSLRSSSRFKIEQMMRRVLMGYITAFRGLEVVVVKRIVYSAKQRVVEDYLSACECVTSYSSADGSDQGRYLEVAGDDGVEKR